MLFLRSHASAITDDDTMTGGQKKADERRVLRSNLRLRLPRPTALKTPSPLSELMWELPIPSAARRRRKSMPGHVNALLQQALPDDCSTSHPDIHLANHRSLSFPNDRLRVDGHNLAQPET